MAGPGKKCAYASSACTYGPMYQSNSPPRLHSDVAGGRRERGADQSAAGVVDAIGIARPPEHVEVDVGREPPAQLEIEPRMDVREVHRPDRRSTERDRTGV